MASGQSCERDNKAIDEQVSQGSLKIDKFIGEKPEDLVHAGGTKFFDMEGVICNL